MRSLRARILLTASLVLVVFLGAASALLDRAFRDSAMDAVEDRLRGRVFMLIGAANFSASPGTPLIESVPDPTLTTPGSGDYARILAGDGSARWESRSLLGADAPPVQAAEPGEWRLERVVSADGESLFSLAYTIIWEGAGDTPPRRFALLAYENEDAYRSTVGRFRRSLWFWFAGLSVALLLVQAVNLGWGLRPLARVGEEVRSIERGAQDRIEGRYPKELSDLTRNLNDLMAHNRDSLRRYRNALGDLAHSLKTPLAVLRNQFERAPGAESASEALEQLERLDRTVEYQLQRAATAGRALLAPPLPLAPAVERLADSLRKVHADRRVEIETRLESGASFPGDEGDLMEIVGNLADNACKWARSSVCIEASVIDDGLVIAITDDGPGIPEGSLDELTKRGARLDSNVEGHGIGLSIVREIVEDGYGGQLRFESSSEGTRVSVELA